MLTSGSRPYADTGADMELFLVALSPTDGDAITRYACVMWTKAQCPVLSRLPSLGQRHSTGCGERMVPLLVCTAVLRNKDHGLSRVTAEGHSGGFPFWFLNRVYQFILPPALGRVGFRSSMCLPALGTVTDFHLCKSGAHITKSFPPLSNAAQACNPLFH